MERTLTSEPGRPELEPWLYSFLTSYQTDLSQFLHNKTVPTLSGSYADSMIGHVNFSSNKHLSIYCVPGTALGLYSQGV